jgi:hypothetical protein
VIDDAEAGAQPHGTAVCPPGALSYPAGVLPFGPGHPVLCVNDQCGYLVEQPKIQAELLVGDFSSIIALARRGMDQGLYVFNVQLMEAHLLPEQRRLMPRIVAAVFQATGCCIAVDARDPGTVDLSLDAYPFKAMCNSVNGEPENLRAMLPVVARHGAAIGTALVYEGGVPKTVAERLLSGVRLVGAGRCHDRSLHSASALAQQGRRLPQRSRPCWQRLPRLLPQDAGGKARGHLHDATVSQHLKPTPAEGSQAASGRSRHPPLLLTSLRGWHIICLRAQRHILRRMR